MSEARIVALPDPEQGERGGWTHASNAEADIECPGRNLAQRGLPEPPSGPDAERGRRIHEALHTGDKSKLNPEELDCHEILYLMACDLIAKWHGDNPAPLTYYREERLWIGVPPFRHSGKPDLLAVDRENLRAILIDYKTGWDDVTASPTNEQLRDLAVLAAVNCGVIEITVAILQPGTNPLPCRYVAADLAQALRALEVRVRASNDPQAPRIAGDHQCRYCRAAGTDRCPEYAAWLAGGLPLLKQEPVLPLTPALLWSPEQRSVFLSRRAALRQWIDEREEECRTLLLADPKAAPGWKVGEPEVRFPIVAPEKVFLRFVELGGRPDVFMGAVKVTKGDLRNAVRSVTGHKGKQLNETMDKLTDGCTAPKECAPSIERVKSK